VFYAIILQSHRYTLFPYTTLFRSLGIARALLHNPELLILDEPTNGLDPIGIKEIRSLILSLAKDRNITIFVSSHILSEIEQLATHMGIIHEGRLLEEIAFDKLR